LAHDTLARDTLVAPARLGVGATLQTVPFQVSIRACVADEDPPTATQFVVAVHATLGSNVPYGNVVSKLHVEPSHVSAKLLVGVPNRPPACSPIAMQAEADAQETPSNTPPPGGLGVD